VGAADHSTSPIAPYVDPARIESANKIIAGCDSYTKWAKTFIAEATKETDHAKKLNATARKFQTTVAPTMKPLTGARLANAKKIYQSDLRQFAAHTAEYRAHTDKVRSMFGQCEASRKAYEANKLNYTLHCAQWHMDNVPPPHVCLEVGTSVAEAKQMANQVGANMRRMAEAEAKLKESEERLNKATGDSANVDAKVRKQHDINLHEQELVAEFARLQEEYKQLSVETRALKSSGVRVPVQTVSGKVGK